MYSFDFENFRKKVVSLGISVRRVQREIGITNYNTARHILDFDEGSLLSRILQFCNTYDLRFEDYLLIDGKPLSLCAGEQPDQSETDSVEPVIDQIQSNHPDSHLTSDLLAVILQHNDAVSRHNIQQLQEAYDRIIAEKERQIDEWKARAERLERELAESPTPDALNPYINDRSHAYKTLNR